MTKLIILLAITVVLAWLSQQRTGTVTDAGQACSVFHDPAYVLLVVILSLFAGLRTGYNDTENYIRGYGLAPELADFLSDPKNLNPFANPLFYLYQSALKALTDDPQMLIFTSAVFSQACFLRFLRRYSRDFVFSMFLYLTLGTYVFSLAAIKQILAMSVLTLAFPCMQEKKWGRYCGLVLTAMLLHTYAVIFLFLPLFSVRPWGRFTWLFVLAVAGLMLNFGEIIAAFVVQANRLGKNLADYEVFDSNRVNLFRLAVYGVPPMISLIFQKWVFYESDPMDHVLVHMSIISLAFMGMGTQFGANMFGRMATYFELGTCCCLPWMLRRIFDKRSSRLISSAAAVCFLGYFAYANCIAVDFSQAYRSVSLAEFLFS